MKESSKLVSKKNDQDVNITSISIAETAEKEEGVEFDAREEKTPEGEFTHYILNIFMFSIGKVIIFGTTCGPRSVYYCRFNQALCRIKVFSNFE